MECLDPVDLKSVQEAAPCVPWDARNRNTATWVNLLLVKFALSAVIFFYVSLVKLLLIHGTTFSIFLFVLLICLMFPLASQSLVFFLHGKY